MKTLYDFNFKNKKVELRCDFNVPLSFNEKIIKKTSNSFSSTINILDDFRIKTVIPTIKYLIEKGAKVILMSHLGSPQGKVVEELRLDPIRKRLMEYLGISIIKTNDCIGREVKKQVEKMKSGEVLLLENLRFHKGEESADDRFVKKLSQLGDIYINEAFGACHRAHASIVGLPKYLPSGIGFLLEKEINVLSGLVLNPRQPLIGIVGGKKVETKSKLIDKISELADWVFVNHLIAQELREKNISLKYPSKIVFPLDGFKGKDIGQKTINFFKKKIISAKTVFLAGPLGKIEEKEFQKGTKKIIESIIKSGAFSIVGGGETVEFLNRFGLAEKFNHVSTGGGAMLDFIVDGELVGLEALK